MEQRHGDVTDVVGADTEDDPHAGEDGLDWLTLDPTPEEVAPPFSLARWWEAGRRGGQQFWRDLIVDYNSDEQASLVARLGDDEPDVGVLDVALQVLAPPRVVEADDGRARQPGAAEGEEVLGHVVEQDADVERRALDAPGEEQVGPAPALGHVLGVGPLPILEADRRPAGDVGVAGVAPEERGGIGRRHGRLAGSGDRLGRRHRLRQ